MEPDPFDDLLGLEDEFYNEGYQLGALDGAKAGRIEGRIFGLEKGFEKYIENGKLHGKSLIWTSRLSKPAVSGEPQRTVSAAMSLMSNQKPPMVLPVLPSNSRLEKHVRVLYALTEQASLATENSEDAVTDFDDRFKRAMGKIKIIEKLIGAVNLSTSGQPQTSNTSKNDSGGAGNIEDVNILKARH